VRLRQIKLAGFKSFVDPTAVEVPGHLVGVVGPNGCGKSNIIDAVRWVLGESKASELRGESMQDVIFNGASDRKPAARASVELVFDNTLSRISGPWASFADVSVKRVLGRDGQSTYLINNQVVRRKDVHDMFLGTGLGPRAYAIIGQGTVARLIEARPEELRVFLEEAAGVSKYKERRRETENRLADTRDNLTRVEDIVRELDAQILRLEQQAEVATQYRAFEAERELKQRMMWLVRRDEARAEEARITEQRAAMQVQIDARLADQRQAEAQLEQVRVGQYEATDALQQAQAAYYEAGSEVSRLESEIRFVVDSQAQLRDRIQVLAAQGAAAERRSGDARSSLERSHEELTSAEARQVALASQLESLTDDVPALEQAVRERRESVDQAVALANATSQQLQVVATRRQGIADALRSLGERESRLRAELSGVGEAPQSQLDEIRQRLSEAETLEAQLGERLVQSEARWSELDSQRMPAQEALRGALANVSRVDARIAVLRQIQERVQTEGKTQPWLARHGLATLKPLWKRLRIEPGWETAIEAALRERVQSLEVERLQSLEGLLAEQPPAKIGFHSAAVTAAVRPTDPAGLLPLARQVHCGDTALQALIEDWLQGAYAAESAADALAARDRLPPGGRFLLRSGHSVGRYGVQLFAMDSEQEGVLARQQELESLGREHRALELLADEARSVAARAESAASQEKERVAADRDALAGATRRAATLRIEAERCAQQVQRASADRTRIEAALADLATSSAEREAAASAESAKFESLDLELMERQDAVERLRAEWEAAQAGLDVAREAVRDAERAERDAAFTVREIEVRRESLRQSIDEADRLARESADERSALQVRLDGLDDRAAKAGLQAALARRVETEKDLAAARERLDDISRRLRELEEARLSHERAQEPLRNRLLELQLKEQAAQLGAQQFDAQLVEAEVDIEALRAEFPQPPKPAWLQGEVTRLGNAIAALGAVNLAALDELSTSRERKAFLDAQYADLTEAIETLEDAIRRIDRETRTLLQETYDTVNRHFGTLFPELFGGGEARLVLTGDEILDSGIQVVAQPPGKRNTSVHQLSGGEKALTAIALVFAMFQLNPAPFCLLDEVDAPLDDANTERYCAMVRRMSNHTQFLFITHNKIAMELAQQLVGVTMQERGVSRIVAVDLEAATGFAEAA
jgi:chromosome segregation protein